MKTSTDTKDLFAALAKAQGEMRGAEKDGNNPHFKSSYATLASVWDACRAPLSKNGLAIVQTLEKSESGWIVETLLTHSSGEFISGSCPVVSAQQSMQSLGSGLTYARRYSLMAIVGLAPEDDDGENAEGRGNGKQVQHEIKDVEFI